MTTEFVMNTLTCCVHLFIMFKIDTNLTLLTGCL